MTNVLPTPTYVRAEKSQEGAYSFSVTAAATSNSAGAIFTSMPNETLSPVAQFAVSIYAYIGIAFLAATILFGLGYGCFRLRRDTKRRNYELGRHVPHGKGGNLRYITQRKWFQTAKLKVQHTLTGSKEFSDDGAKFEPKISVPNTALIRTGSDNGFSSTASRRAGRAPSTIQMNGGEDIKPHDTQRKPTPQMRTLDIYTPSRPRITTSGTSSLLRIPVPPPSFDGLQLPNAPNPRESVNNEGYKTRQMSDKDEFHGSENLVSFYR